MTTHVDIIPDSNGDPNVARTRAWHDVCGIEELGVLRRDPHEGDIMRWWRHARKI
jgi:hypothetical protein